MAPVTRRLAVLAVFVLLAVVTVRGLDRPFGNGDEVVYAEGVRTMQTGGDYGTLHWQGQPVLERPTTPFWSVALVSSVVNGELGLRLVSGLCSLAILVLVFFLARGVGLGWAAATASAIACAGVPSFHEFSRALLSDPHFAVATTFALLAAAALAREPRRSLVPVALALGAAFACKSLAALIPAVALSPWILRAAWARRDRADLLRAAAAFVLLAAPFFVWSSILHGDEFWAAHVGRTVIDRARGEVGMGMPGGPMAYLIYTWQAEGPALAIALALGAAGCVLIALREHRPDLGVIGGFPLLAFIGYSLVGTRLPHYLLPIYPAAAVSLVVVLDRLRATLSSSSLSHAVPVAIAVALFSLGIGRAPEEHFMPSPSAVALGKALRQGSDLPPGPIYTAEWYAPAVGYYADRRFVVLTESRSLHSMLDAIDHVHAAGVVKLAPPWPEGEVLVAGERALLAQWPLRARIVAESGEHVVLRARFAPQARSPLPPWP